MLKFTANYFNQINYEQIVNISFLNKGIDGQKSKQTTSICAVYFEPILQ